MKLTFPCLRAALALTLLLAATTGAAFAYDVTPEKLPTNAPAAKPATAKKPAPKKVVSRRPRPQPVQMAPTPARISEIQAALATAGSYQGSPTGKLDTGTVEGLTQFQSSHGLTPTGKINALTLEKLGLGGETAGRGAPLPLPSASKAPDPAPQNP